ncbi:hypothetical protein [Granulicella tundricola]|uniref:Secreted protein n=1 Tax=Granulicella tundricola (strain ATCC BAA-1859 / DSM 23138 / MP5ACTX9) TaxID=1198114 RepID=E8X819_GRATM|nr:hypothetical protein [Granulicella tundricola]ADW71603.1 hypothetical protein AciX9_4674 [Granulicella tundricola MP5ACTX9]
MRSKVILPLSCLLFAAATCLAHAQTSVPYIGCSGDGQTGPYLAKTGSPKPVNLPPAVAAQLAWYEYSGDAGHFGTLGPRGWNCFATIGSDGWTLYVAPEVLDGPKLLEHKKWKGFTGPAIQFSGSDGETSGRFEVAKVVARVFPAHRGYARKIIAEGFGSPSDYPFGAFLSDQLNYKSKELVEFTTPAHRRGLGTMSWLLPSDQPITGFALLSIGSDVDTELMQLSFRLPPSLSFLASTLIKQGESGS